MTPVRSDARARQLITCEALERRQLLAADITVLVSDGTSFNAAQSSQPFGSPRRIDFGTLVAGAPNSAAVKTLALRNDGNATLTITSLHRLHEGNHSWFRFEQVPGYQFPAPDTTQSSTITAPSITLAPGQIYCTRIVFPTYTQIEFNNTSSNFIEIKSNDPDEGIYKFFVYGQVVKPSVSQPMFMSFSGDTIDVPQGLVRAHHFLDGLPDRIIQTEDAAVFFELPTRSDLRLTLHGYLVEEFNSNTKLRYFLTRDQSNVNVLDLSERVNKIGEWITADLSADPAPRIVNLSNLQAGRYILHVSIHSIPSTGSDGPDYRLGYDMSVRRTALPLPGVAVTGKDDASIASGDTTPTTSDGTSFGTWGQQEQQLPQLSFTVRNSGPAGAPDLTAALSVTGDFELINGLPSGGVPRGGAGDLIILRLRGDRTDTGAKSGRLTIDPHEPGVPNFFFDLAGTVTAPTQPPPNFATLDPGTKILTVAGTSGDDAIFVTLSGPSVVVQRNGQSMNFVTAQVGGIVVNALAGNDTVSTSAAVRIPQTLNGGAGRDSLLGGKGDDLLNGDEDHDFLDGGGGHDTLVGGTGSDTVRYSRRKASEPIRVTLDEVADDGDVAAGERDNIRADVEHVIGGAGDDYIEGNKKINRLRGFGGNDTLVGGAGPDLLDGGDGDDVIYGFYDRAIPNVTDSPNDLRGGAGNDRIFAANGVIDSVSGGEGTDVFEGDEDDLVTLVP